MAWQLQEAKQKFSQVVQRARDEGPQLVTRHGEVVAVVLSAEKYRELTEGEQDFKDFLLSGPDLSVLELERSSDGPRELEL